MSRAATRQPARSALDLLEQATHLVRTAPLGVLALYFVGTLPFILGGLAFWADMSRSPYAYQHLAGATLGMAALFVWMKFWQTLFARQLRALLVGTRSTASLDSGKNGNAPERVPPRLRHCGRILLAQAALQPTGLFLLPLASIPILPFGWAYAFYQNLTALDEGESLELLPLFHKARRQAGLWPGQNHLLLALLLGFGLAVFLNWGMVCYLIPGLLKMFFGVESAFTRSRLGMLNTTFFATILGLTYLSVDPIAKAAYVLRCFYGESVQSGEDLKAELRSFLAPARVVVLCLLATLALPARSADFQSGVTIETGPASPLSSISPPTLDRAIQDVIRQSKYTWRAPREKLVEPDSDDQGVLGRFLERVWDLVLGALQKAFKGLGTVVEWLAKWLGRIFGRFFRNPNPGTGGYGWIMSLNLMLYLLVAAVVLGLLYLGYRIWRNRRPRDPLIASEPITPMPDVADENVGADQLAQDAWVQLARELLAKGDLRLALRAFYLASLAHLAERNLLSIARFKSNRDYERELRRRGHSYPDLLATFGENVTVFECIWYGLHDVSLDLVTEFAAKVERMRAASTGGGPA